MYASQLSPGDLVMSSRCAIDGAEHEMVLSVRRRATGIDVLFYRIESGTRVKVSYIKTKYFETSIDDDRVVRGS